MLESKEKMPWFNISKTAVWCANLYFFPLIKKKYIFKKDTKLKPVILAKQELNNIQQLVEKQVIFYFFSKLIVKIERKNIVLNNIFIATNFQ